jgi:hypothetical protein
MRLNVSSETATYFANKGFDSANHIAATPLQQSNLWGLAYFPFVFINIKEKIMTKAKTQADYKNALFDGKLLVHNLHKLQY